MKVQYAAYDYGRLFAVAKSAVKAVKAAQKAIGDDSEDFLTARVSGETAAVLEIKGFDVPWYVENGEIFLALA